MDQIPGKDFILLMEVADTDGTFDGSYLPVAQAKNHTLSVGGEVKEYQSKSTGGWKGKKYGYNEWSISADGLASFDTGVCNIEKLMAAKINKEKVKVAAIVVDPANVPLADATAITTAAIDDATFKASTTYYIGTGVIGNVDVGAPDGDDATFNISIEGDGALTPTAVPSAT